MSQNAQLNHLLEELIETNTIREQAELQDLLLKRGHNVPQATLSRRLKKLKIAKVQGVYTRFQSGLGAAMVLKIETTDAGLVVLHTYPGHAGSVAAFLDQKYVTGRSSPGVLGTIAGDDTILMIARNHAAAKALMLQLAGDFPKAST